jgi:hypothetical protein
MSEVGASHDEWMFMSLQAPAVVVEAVMQMLKTEHGFRGIVPIDWCVMEREPDYAHLDYAPCEVGANRYVVDWRKGEGRGDVVVRVEES